MTIMITDDNDDNNNDGYGNDKGGRTPFVSN